MRIGFDGKRALRNTRGLGNYSRSLLEGLLAFYPEHEYVLYSPLPKQERLQQWLGAHRKLLLRQAPGALALAPDFIWRSLLLSRDLKRDRLDLYHGLSHELPPGIGKLPIKKVVTIHDLIFLREPQFFPWIDRQVYLQKFKYSCGVADCVIAISEQTKQDLIEMLKVPEAKISVRYQCVSPIFYQPPSVAQVEAMTRDYKLPRPYFLFVGALEERKNAFNVLSAFHQWLRQKNKPTGADLVLVGQGRSYKQMLINKILDWGLKDHVRLLDRVPFSDLPALYAGATAFFYPSFFEGFGLPIVESLFSGTPVVTSHGSCFPEAAGPGAIYVNPHKVDELAHSMHELWENESRRRELALLGQSYVQRFRQERTTSELMELYQHLLG